MYIQGLEHITTIKKEKDYYNEIDKIEKIYRDKNILSILEGFQNHFTKNKIKYLRGTFSGGHDEGGFDEIEFLDNDKNVIKQVDLQCYFITQYNVLRWDNKNMVSLFYYEKHIDYDLTKKADQFLFNTGCLDKYGSFAFEGNVNGTVIFDLIEKKLQVSGDEEYHTYENFEETMEFKDGDTSTSCAV